MPVNTPLEDQLLYFLLSLLSDYLMSVILNCWPSHLSGIMISTYLLKTLKYIGKLIFEIAHFQKILYQKGCCWVLKISTLKFLKRGTEGVKKLRIQTKQDSPVPIVNRSLLLWYQESQMFSKKAKSSQYNASFLYFSTVNVKSIQGLQSTTPNKKHKFVKQ